MPFDPTSLPLGDLFADVGMFDSRKAWRRAGFDVLDPAKDTECMVAGHRSAPGYLFKRYTDDVSQREQRANYETRLAGARALARFITEQGLLHVAVPHKHLHDVSSRSQVLVVERLDIVGRDESERMYRSISDPVLRELLRVLVHHKGLDSNSKNVQFTRGGKIAFIDLEHWNRTDRDRVRLKSIGDYLSKDGRRRARKILDELE